MGRTRLAERKGQKGMQFIMHTRFVLALLYTTATLSDAFIPCARNRSMQKPYFTHTKHHIYSTIMQQKMPMSFINRSLDHRGGTSELFTNMQDENEAMEEDTESIQSPTKLQLFFESMLEIPDTRLFAGDILFLLIINFLLQIADEVGDSTFWLNGGFSQPITMPTTLLALVVRDSKMTISWILGALWNRSYSYSSVSDDKTAIKKTFNVWVDYFSLRIILELTGSLLITHSPVDVWPLVREVWYTAIVMCFFRVAYGRFLSNFF